MGIHLIKRGGARPGSGPKPKGKLRRHVYLLPASITTLTELGGGELSSGIDMAAKRVARLHPIGNGLWQESEE